MNGQNGSRRPIFDANSVFTGRNLNKSRQMRVADSFFRFVRDEQIDIKNEKNVILTDPQITNIIAQEMRRLKTITTHKKIKRPTLIDTNIF